MELFSCLHILSLQALESVLGDVDMGDQGVQFVHRVLILVPQAGQADPHAEWDAPDALGPDGLVEPGINPYVLGSHLRFSKFLDLLNCPRSSVLETNPVETLVQIDGVLTGDDLSHGRVFSLLCPGHFC